MVSLWDTSEMMCLRTFTNLQWALKERERLTKDGDHEDWKTYMEASTGNPELERGDSAMPSGGDAAISTDPESEHP